MPPASLDHLHPTPPPTGLATWTTALAAAIAALPCALFQPDDLFIYLRMVRNILSGAGWGFNPGEAINVASSPAWLLTLLSAGKISGSLDPRLAQWIGAVGMMLAIAGTVRLATGLSGHRLAGWIAGIALAGDAWVMRWFWSGMETGWAMAIAVWSLVLLGSDHHIGPIRHRAGWRGPLGAILLALAPLVRPELALLAGVALIVWCVEAPWHGWRQPIWIGSAIAVTGSLWALFSWRTWGTVIPASVVAKGSLGEAGIDFFPAAARVVAAIGGTQVLAAIAAGYFGLRWALGDMPTARQRVARTILAFCVLLVLIYALRHVKIYTRYALPATALCVALGAAGFAHWLHELSPPRGRRIWALALVTTLAINLVLATVLIVPATRDYARSMRETVFPLAERLRVATQPGDVIATPNIGAIGFVTDRTILDLNGLATPAILPFKRDGRELAYVASHPPRYLLEMAPHPGLFAAAPKGLKLERIETQVFHHMFVTRPDPIYLTVYRVAPEVP